MKTLTTRRASALTALNALVAALLTAACAPISTQDAGGSAAKSSSSPAGNEAASPGSPAQPAMAGAERAPGSKSAPETRGGLGGSAAGFGGPTGLPGGPPNDNRRADPQTLTGEPAVVVELFTSEGCSSCPPADDLLHEMATNAKVSRSPVYFLSFHVDYWNDLGWPDPFSSRANTERQRAYAAIAGTSQVYTPQMIIGGSDAFVGSDRERALRGVEVAMGERSKAAVSLRATAGPGQAPIDVSYAVTGAPAGSVLNLALVEDGLSVRVPRGENAGKTLAHDAVVRLFRSFPLDRGVEGKVSLAWPEGVVRSKASLVAYAQQTPTLEILGAAGAKLE